LTHPRGKRFGGGIFGKYRYIGLFSDNMIHFNGERFLGPYPDVMPKSE